MAVETHLRNVDRWVTSTCRRRILNRKECNYDYIGQKNRETRKRKGVKSRTLQGKEESKVRRIHPYIVSKNINTKP